jgi:methylmalonyl-CoA/ethylmalonyl-CoA epimerase
MKILGLHHVAIATNDNSKQGELLQSIFGLVSRPAELNAENKINLTFFDVGNTALELIEPLGEDSPIAKYLARRGPGIHHICFLVDDLDQALNELIEKNIRMIDSRPRRGAGGSKIAFIHPESTGGILIELKENSH